MRSGPDCVSWHAPRLANARKLDPDDILAPFSAGRSAPLDRRGLVLFGGHGKRGVKKGGG